MARQPNAPRNRILNIGTPSQTVLPLPVPPLPAKGASRPIITPEDIRKFREDGVIVLRNAISPEWIRVLQSLCENALVTQKEAKLGANYTPRGKPGQFYQELDAHRRMDKVKDWIRDGPMGEIAGTLMESEYSAFLYDQLFVKEVKTEDITPWHQDRPYWAVTGTHVSSLWIPLDPTNKETCVQYVRGSHKWHEHAPTRFNAGNQPYKGNSLPALPDIDKGNFELLAWDMMPGDVLCFDAMTVHGSKGNLRMDTRRRAWAFRFVGDDHKFVDQPGREWGWPVTDLWAQGLKQGDELTSHPDHQIVWRRDEGGLGKQKL